MIARRSLLPIANVAVGAVLGLVALKVVTTYFDVAAYGEFENAIAALGLLYIFTELSMGEAHVKRVSQGMDAADCFATYAVFRLATSLILIVVAVGGYLLYSLVLGRTIEDTTVPALGLALVYYVAKAGQSVIQSTFDAKLETARSQLGAFVETAVRVAFTIWAALVFVALAEARGPLAGLASGDGVTGWIRDNPAAAITLAWGLGSVAASMAMAPYLHDIRGGRFRWTILRSYFAFALPLFLPTTVSLIAFFIDRNLLFVFGNQVDTANFAAPRRIVSVLEGIAGAIMLILFPAMSSLAASGARDAATPVLDRAVRYLSILILPLTTLMVVFPGTFMSILTADKLQGGAPVLAILALWAFLFVVSRPHLSLLLGHGHVKAAAKIAIIMAATNIALNLVLIPDDIKSLGLRLFGLKAVGAALATLASGALGYVLLLREARKLEGYRQQAPLHKHVAAAAVMGLALWSIDRFTGFHAVGTLRLTVFALVGTAIFLGTLWALRELTRDDVRYVKETTHPGEMWRYLKSELGRRRS